MNARSQLLESHTAFDIASLFHMRQFGLHSLPIQDGKHATPLSGLQQLLKRIPPKAGMSITCHRQMEDWDLCHQIPGWLGRISGI